MLTLLAIYAVGVTLLVPLVARKGVQYKRQMLLAKSENAVLSDRLIASTEQQISDWDIDYYLERTGVKHTWVKTAKSHIEGTLERTKYKDTLQTHVCERCGLIKRTWVHGVGRAQYPELAGYFRGERQIHHWVSEQNLRCLPAPDHRPLPPGFQPKLLTE